MMVMRRSLGNNMRQRNALETVGPQLHDACKRHPRHLSLIQEITENCPEATLYYKDSDQRTALHLLCSNKAPLSVVQYVASRCINAREACLQQTSKGMMPLHYACREQAPVEVIRFLVSHYPEAADHATTSGWLPLHLACARQASADVVQLLIQASPQSVQECTQDDRLPLHFACANQASLPVIVVLVRSFKHAIPIQDRNEWTPLHIACAYSNSVDVVKHLVEQWRDGLLCRGKNERLPLHVACWEGQSLEIVRFLLNECPETLNMRDIAGLLPIHAACQGSASMEVVRYLISVEPNSALELGRNAREIATYISSNGNIRGAPPPPLELIAWIEQVVEIPPQEHQLPPRSSNGSVERFIPPAPLPSTEPRPPMASFTSAVSMQSSSSKEFTVVAEAERQMSQSCSAPQQTRSSQRNSTVMEQDIWSAGQRLHRACEAPQSLRIIRELLSEFPASIEYRTYGGLCPIHTACLNQASVDVMECLTRLHPQSLHQKDDEGNLPIHLACFSSAPLESIRFLVRQWPESLHIQNKNGELAVERSRHPFLENPDPQTISFLEMETARIASAPAESESRPRGSLSSTAPIPPVGTPESAARSSSSSLPPFSPAIASSPMGVDEVRKKLATIRTSKANSSRIAAATSVASVATGAQRKNVVAVGTGTADRMKSPRGRPELKNYMVPQSPAVRMDERFSQDAKKYPAYRTVSRSPSPMGRQSATANESSYPKASPSPARRVLRGAARLFQGGGKSGDKGTGGKEKEGKSPNFRLPFIGGRGSRNNSPNRTGGSRNNSRNNSPTRTVNSPTSNQQSIGGDRIPDHPLDYAIMKTLPPRPNPGMDGNELFWTRGPPTRPNLNRHVSNDSCEGPEMNKPNLNRHVSNDAYESSTTSQSNATRREVALQSRGGLNVRTHSPGGIRSERSRARTSETRTVVDAGMLTERPTRPGVVAVNEPAMRADSAMYRAAYGRSTIDGGTSHSSTSRYSGTSIDVDQTAAPDFNRNASQGSSFEAPAGVDEVRATLEALRQTKKMTKQQEEAEEEEQRQHQLQVQLQQEESGRSVGIEDSPLLQKNEISSFYRAAMADAQSTGPDFRGETTAATGVAALPSRTSSFYEAALKEASSGVTEKVYREDTDRSGHLPKEFVNFPEESGRGVEIESALEEDDRKPAATLKSPPPTTTGAPEASLEGAGRTLNRDSVQSSFYRAALAHAQGTSIPNTTDWTTPPPQVEDDRKPSPEKPISSFYRAALEDATSGSAAAAAAIRGGAMIGSKLEQPDSRLTHPDDLDKSLNF